MWTYIVRRLFMMIPTLFGVTIVSFCIMQLAPGDPVKAKLGASGMAGQSSQTREAYLVQKRDLHLDKPLLLNLRYFTDYTEPIRQAAFFLSLDEKGLATAMAKLAAADAAADAESAGRLAFLRSLRIPGFEKSLENTDQHKRLAVAIPTYVTEYCENIGEPGVPAAIALLESSAERPMQIGAIRCLGSMVVDPIVSTYRQPPSETQTPWITAVWQRWWKQAQEADRRRAAPKAKDAKPAPPEYPPLSAERRASLEKRFAAILTAPTRKEMLAGLEFFDPDAYRPFEPTDMPFFVEKLTDEPRLEAKVAASLALTGYVGQPLMMSVSPDTPAEELATVAENWRFHFEHRRADYEPSLPARLGYILGDTQYAHMISRLVTFQFGRSLIRTREPVSDLIWSAVLVSAPLMFFAELVIYLVAVPLGIVCAVHRGKWIDRLISLKLFLLYSIPPAVAGMLLLLLFCYGDYLRLFPMEGLHSDLAHEFGPVRYAVDYLWHIFLPVVCLSLFSLAGMAMYSRSSMLDVVGQDYIRTARAKGLPESKVIFKHGLRNALIPVITLFANFLPAMLGGSVLIEVIFGIPGMGRLSWESIEQKDYTTLMALLYLDAILVMLSMLLTDLLYVVVDPRISFESQGEG